MSGALKIMWTAEAWDDYVYWQDQNEKTLKRINRIIVDVQGSPLEGIGKPDPLMAKFDRFLGRVPRPLLIDREKRMGPLKGRRVADDNPVVTRRFFSLAIRARTVRRKEGG